jgi:hypothetical protein
MNKYSCGGSTRPVRYAARQPILANDETVIGYRLLFRTDVAILPGMPKGPAAPPSRFPAYLA